MTISSYTFQSPYPNQIQVGRPDPQPQHQAQRSEGVDTFSKAENRLAQEQSEAYIPQTQTGASVNIAQTSTASSVSSALNSFTTINNQVQAETAYSG